MRIGVPRQSDHNERRVAVTPDIAGKLAESGHQVVVERSAGIRAGFGDDHYTGAGATLGEAEDAWSAEFIATVSAPDDLGRLRGAAAIIGLLHPFDHPSAMADLAATGITAFAFEAVPRTTRAQVVDALSSQATAAGYQAVLEAAGHCTRFFPMLTTAAGTIAPAKVLVLGAGVAGLQAIATARRLGAVVSAFDVRAAAAEQVESLGARFVVLDVEPQDAANSGGYARQLEDEAQERVIRGLAAHVSAADAVISTAAIPGREAPLLIRGETVSEMKRGSVIVDLAASTGGNCDVTRPGESVVHDGVLVMGETDLVSRVATHASQMYAKNVAAFLKLVDSDGSLTIDFDDDIVAGSCITHDGQVVNERVRTALEES